MKTVLTLVTILSLTACGAQDANNVAAAALGSGTGGITAETSNIKSGAFIVDTATKLPACTSDTQGNLSYVRADSKFYTCDDSQWVSINIDGQAGTDGSNGVNGSNGSNGSNGTNALDYLPNVIVKYTPSTVVGKLIDVSDNTSSVFTYAVVLSNGIRMQMNPLLGTMQVAEFLYAGVGCTGERRLARNQWTYANTQVEATTNKVYQMRPGTLGGTTAQSRRQTNGVCVNSVGSVNGFLVDEITIPGYPFGELDIQN